MSEIAFIDVQPRRADTGDAVTVRLAGGGTDTPYRRAAENYHAGVVAMPRFRAAFGFDDNGWTGGTVPTNGEIGFVPGASSLMTELLGYYWRDAAITIDAGEEGGVLIRRLTGTVADVVVNEGQLQLTIADPSKLLDKPLLGAGFTGEGGIEGPSEATGRPKRRSWGRVYDVEGGLLDKASNIYEFGDPSKPIGAFDAVRDKGRAGAIVELPWQGNVAATFTALQAADAPDGGCVAAPSIACVKWWTVPAGPLTADIRGENSGGYSETAAGIVAKMLAAVGGPALADLAAAEALRPAPCGVHIAVGTDTVAQAIDRLLLGVSLYWVLQPDATVRIGEWAWGAPVASFQAIFIARERQLPPVKTRKVGYRRNHRVHGDSEISAAVILADDVSYLDGTPLEDLKPAEGGATDGATIGDDENPGNLKDGAGNPLTEDDLVTSKGTAFNTSNVGPFTTAEFTGKVEEAEADIAALFATYGDTASASAAAAAAAQAKDDALAAASASEGFASISSTKRDEAAGFASAAQADAVTAGDAATVATAKAVEASDAESSAATSATLSATYRGAAQDAASATYPGDFTDPSQWISRSSWGGSVVFSGGQAIGADACSVQSTWRMPIDPAKTYRFTLRYKMTSVPAGSNHAYLGQNLWDADGNEIGLIGWLINGVPYSESAGAIVTRTIDVLGSAIPGYVSGAKMNVVGLAGYDATGPSITEFIECSIRDVTSEVAATTQAGIATTQAAAANAAAAVASSSETLTASYRDAAKNALAQTHPEDMSGGTDYYAVWPHAGVGFAGFQTDNDNGGIPVMSVFAGVGEFHPNWSFPATPGHRYRIEVVARCNGAGNELRVSAFASTQAGAPNGPWLGWVGSHADVGSSGYAKYTWEYDVGASPAAPFIGFNLHLTAAGGLFVYVRSAKVTDITSEVAANTQANISTAQAAIATAQAAASQQSAVLSASVGPGYLNRDPGFDNYPSGTVGHLPPNWGGGYGYAGAYRTADEHGGYALALPAPAGGDAYVQQDMFSNPTVQSGGWYVLEADIFLVSGSLTGAGVLFRPRDSGLNTYQDLPFAFSTNPDQSGTAPGAGVAGRAYQFRSLVKITTAGLDRFSLFLMSHWNALGSNADANLIIWRKLGVRPATQAEIRDQTVLAPLEATVATHSSTLATHDTRLASWLQRVAAGPGYAQIKMTALDSNGATATVIDMAADRITLGLTTVLEVVAGKVTVNGDLHVQNGRIVVDTGTHMKVIGNGFGSTNQFVEWFGPRMAINLCSEANGTQWLKKDGSGYFGGSLSAGVLKNSAQTSELSTTASVICGPFGTNGNPIVVAVSWTYTHTHTKDYLPTQMSAFNADVANYNASSSDGGFSYYGTIGGTVPNSTVTLARKIGSGSFADVASGATTQTTTTFVGYPPVPYDEVNGYATITTVSVVSFTYTDSAGGISDREFRATLSRGYTGGSGSGAQRISIVTTEE
jgi:hypothetical protein